MCCGNDTPGCINLLCVYRPQYKYKNNQPEGHLFNVHFTSSHRTDTNSAIHADQFGEVIECIIIQLVIHFHLNWMLFNYCMHCNRITYRNDENSAWLFSILI